MEVESLKIDDKSQNLLRFGENNLTLTASHNLNDVDDPILLLAGSFNTSKQKPLVITKQL